MDRLDRVGAVVVIAFVALLAVGVAEGLDDTDPSAVGATDARPVDDPAATSLVEAWAATRTLTHRSVGTFERVASNGNRLEAPTEVVQRRPDRLLRGFQETSGRRDDRVLSCPAPLAEGVEPTCSLGPPGPSFDEVVAEEVTTFRGLVTGDDPLYEVERTSQRCWRLTRTRFDPRPGYGQHADLCFDDATGALRSIVIDHGDVVETTTYTDISTDVTDADLEP